MHGHLTNLVQILREECEIFEPVTTKTTLPTLQLLSFVEKDAVAIEFQRWPWNIGSAKVLAWLQEARILSATEYVVAKHDSDAEEAQMIMNDLLEIEYKLLADLCRHIECVNAISTKAVEILSEAVIRLCLEVCDDPAVLKRDYLLAITPLLLTPQINAVRRLHLKTFLEKSHENTIAEAISKWREWSESEFIVSSKPVCSLLRSCATENKSDTLVNVLQCSKDVRFTRWRFYLLMLKVLLATQMSDAEMNSIKAVAKGYVKTCFHKYLTDGSDSMFLAMMLTARQMCASNQDILGSYGAWYKATIGEMKYTLKPDEFNKAMAILINMLELENDTDILNIHINTSVPAPPFCNDIVLNYKQMCRSRVFLLNQKARSGTATEEPMDVFVIDD